MTPEFKRSVPVLRNVPGRVAPRRPVGIHIPGAGDLKGPHRTKQHEQKGSAQTDHEQETMSILSREEVTKPRKKNKTHGSMV